jgi:hypothetical protein
LPATARLGDRPDVPVGAGEVDRPDDDEVAARVHADRRGVLVLARVGDDDLAADLAAGGVVALRLDVVIAAGLGLGPDDDGAAGGGAGDGGLVLWLESARVDEELGPGH